MAAVINLHPRPSDHPEPARRAQPPQRPHLVVVEGGRSQRSRSRRRRFALRRTFAAGAAVVLIAAAVMLAMGIVTAVTTVDAAPALPASHVVAPGETMWEIARSLDLGIDVRIVVSELSDANGGSSVRAGQTLVIADALSGL